MCDRGEYVNERFCPDLKDSERCQYKFSSKGMKGKRCGLARDPEDEHCFWHRVKKEEQVSGDGAWQGKRKELDELVKGEACLEEVRLECADLQEMDLQAACLVKADLRWAKMQEANLKGANVAGADFRGACLSEARLLQAQNILTTDPQPTRFEGVEWGDHKRPEEGERDKGKTGAPEYDCIEGGYRWLKLALRQCGVYEEDAQFYYREMECRRKGARRVGEKVWLTIYKVLCGYGERPWRTFLCVLGLNVVPMFVLWGVGGLKDYGDFQPVTLWEHLSAIAQPLVNTFLMALFVVCFARKVMRG